MIFLAELAFKSDRLLAHLYRYIAAYVNPPGQYKLICSLFGEMCRQTYAPHLNRFLAGSAYAALGSVRFFLTNAFKQTGFHNEALGNLQQSVEVLSMNAGNIDNEFQPTVPGSSFDPPAFTEASVTT